MPKPFRFYDHLMDFIFDKNVKEPCVNNPFAGKLFNSSVKEKLLLSFNLDIFGLFISLVLRKTDKNLRNPQP